VLDLKRMGQEGDVGVVLEPTKPEKPLSTLLDTVDAQSSQLRPMGLPKPMPDG
jgi:hypothetical protein